MIQTVDFVASYVNSKHGWAVAEQFTDSFNGEAFEEQNYNALLYIRDTVRSILKSNCRKIAIKIMKDQKM